MSKIITIPDCKDPYEVIVNNKKYTYRSGEVVEVPDEVAEIIALHEDVQHPPIRLPEKPSGSNITVDSELSDTSTNPVENQAVTQALGGKLDKQNLSGQGFPEVYVIDTDNIQKLFKADKDITSTPYGAIVRRFGYGDVYLPKTPSTDNSATPKKWVLDQIANAGGGSGSTKVYVHNITFDGSGYATMKATTRRPDLFSRDESTNVVLLPQIGTVDEQFANVISIYGSEDYGMTFKPIAPSVVNSGVLGINANGTAAMDRFSDVVTEITL